MQPSAPQVHPAGNVLVDEDDGQPGDSYTRGDVERGLAEAEVVVAGTWRTPHQAHNCLETHGVVAVWLGDHLTVYESTQYICGVRNRLADALGLPQNEVRV